MRILTIAAMLGSLCLLPACETVDTPMSSAGPGYLDIESTPAGALVSFPDGTTCETPCTVDVNFDMTVKIAKIGYKAGSYELKAGMEGVWRITLELVAPTTDVESGELPEL